MTDLVTGPDSCIRLTCCLVAIAVLHESLGYLAIIRQFRPDGIYAWELVKRHGYRMRVTKYLPSGWEHLAGVSGMVLFHLTRILAAALLVLEHLPLRAGSLWLLVALGVLQHNRTFFLNGSEVFLRVTIIFLALAHSVPGSVLLREAGLWFVAGNLVLSYAGNGWAKFADSSWRRGEVLQRMARDPVFGCDAVNRVTGSNLLLVRSLSVTTLVLQCLFPLSLVTGIEGCLVFVSWALVFHALNAALFGLATFLVALPVGFPALCFVAHRIQLLNAGG